MKLEISDKATNLLVKNIAEHAWIDIDLTNADKEVKDTLTQAADANNQEEAQVIYDTYFWKIPIEKVAAKNNITPIEVRKMLGVFKKKLKMIKTNNRKHLGKKAKLNQHKLGLIKDFLDENKFKFYKLNDIRLYLLQKAGGQFTVSNSTIGKAMNNSMQMTFKKVNKIHPSVIAQQTKRKMAEALSIQMELSLRGIAIVYCDEF